MSRKLVSKRIKDLATHLVSLGFKVYMSKSGTYGFYTERSNRIVQFGVDDLNYDYLFWGCYQPVSQEGTGWRIKELSYLPTKKEAQMFLSAYPNETWRADFNPVFETEASYLKRNDFANYTIFVTEEQINNEKRIKNSTHNRGIHCYR